MIRDGTRTTLGAALCTAAALALGPAPGAAGEETAEPAFARRAAADLFSDALTPPRFFRVRGELVCLDCDPDRSHLAEAMAHCREAGHRHGLRTRGGALFELRAEDETALERLYSADLYGKPVSVDGKLFRSRRALSSGEVGSIVVQALSPRS